MQLELRTSGSPNFFMFDPDTIPETDKPTGTITLPEAWAKAELLIDTSSSGFNEKTETILGILYATGTVPIRRSGLHGDKHKIFAALIALMATENLKLEEDEYSTSEHRTFGYSMSFMQFLAKAEARYVLNVVLRTQHKAIYWIGEGVVESLKNGDK